jgi:hypothetical protein
VKVTISPTAAACDDNDVNGALVFNLEEEAYHRLRVVGKLSSRRYSDRNIGGGSKGCQEGNSDSKSENHYDFRLTYDREILEWGDIGPRFI